MRWGALALLLATSCKRKEVPYQPPPKDDAAIAVADAAAGAADAAQQASKAVATKVAVGDHVTCAILSDATLRCWGKNSDGQLGSGTTTDSLVPVTVPLRGVTDVVIGKSHVCALLDDTSVTCWGGIQFGKAEPLLRPTAVPGLTKAKQLFAVGRASCATLTDGPLVCWGDVDVQGHPRLSAGAPEHRAPTPVPDVDHVIAMTASGALRSDHTTHVFASEAMPALTGVTEIGVNGAGLCGLRDDGSVACVGPRHCAPAPQRPMPTSAPKKSKAKTKAKPKPTKPAKPAPLAPEVLALPAAKHLAFDVGLCVVTTTGKLVCVDSKDECRADDPWPGLTDVEIVSGSCARLRTGAVKCWAIESKRVVTSVAGVARASQLAGAASHVCALSTGELFCWGTNRSGAGAHADAKPVSF